MQQLQRVAQRQLLLPMWPRHQLQMAKESTALRKYIQLYCQETRCGNHTAHIGGQPTHGVRIGRLLGKTLRLSSSNLKSMSQRNSLNTLHSIIHLELTRFGGISQIELLRTGKNSLLCQLRTLVTLHQTLHTYNGSKIGTLPETNYLRICTTKITEES